MSEVIPLTNMGARVVQLKQFAELTDPNCYYSEWCELYIDCSKRFQTDWGMARTRVPFLTNELKQAHLKIVTEFCRNLTLGDIKASINRLTESWVVVGLSDKLISNYLHQLSWFILYLYITQKGIPWTYYESMVKKATAFGMRYNQEQRGLTSLLFYDPFGLLQIRNEMLIGLCRMQPFFNFVIEKAIREDWRIGYTDTSRSRSNTDETRILYNMTKLMLPWLDLAMRLTNIPWRSEQLKALKLWEPKHSRDTLRSHDKENTPFLFLNMVERVPQYIRQWKIKGGIARKTNIDEPIRYSLGETISGYMWFFWEYGYRAYTRPRKEFVLDSESENLTLNVLQDREEPDQEVDYPKLFQGVQNSDLTQKLRHFILNYLHLSASSLRFMETHGKNLSLFLQHVVLASYTCRVSPYDWKSTQIHAWAHMNDLTLGISDKFHSFWKVHYQQIRGFKHVVKELGNEHDFQTWYEGDDDSQVWVELTPFTPELKLLLHGRMIQTLAYDGHVHVLPL